MPINKSSIDTCMSDFKKEFPAGRKKKKKKMSKKDINAQRYAACNSMVKEDSHMNTIVIYGGRFHPPHKGHKSVYDHLVKQFGEGSVYVVSSNKQAPVSSPFEFEQKKKLWTFLGVPNNHIVQVKNPYMPKEVTDHIDTANTSIVFAVSAKDAERFTFKPKKDGSPSYMQPFGPDRKSIDEGGYILIVPTIEFDVLGKPVQSASEIRGMYIRSSNANRVQILKDLYSKVSAPIKAMFDKQLSLTETIMKLVSNRTLVEGTQMLKHKGLIAKARILEDRIAKDEFLHKR